MSKYIIEFTKTGTICFTSHLDLMRIWRRVFKRTGIALAYSQGFNPHPKMGFAQPLSLGYWGMEEYIEFETGESMEPDQLLQRLAQGLPEGIELIRCLPADALSKTLASHTAAGQFIIAVPVEEAPAAEAPMEETPTEESAVGTQGAKQREVLNGSDAQCSDAAPGTCSEAAWREKPDSESAAEALPQPGDPAVEIDPEVDITNPHSMWDSYMGMEEIRVWKRQKKKKEPKKVDIRPMIREITFAFVPEEASGSNDPVGCDSAGFGRTTAPSMESSAESPAESAVCGTLYIDTTLDSGSDSNLSPELVISSVLKRFGIHTDRSEINVMRKRIFFDRPLEELL